MNRIAAFLVVLVAIPAYAEAPKAEQSVAPAGWSFATEGSGIPLNQKANEYAPEVDHKVTHGGKAAVSIRSIVAKPTGARSVTQLIKADAYRGKRVRLAGYLKTRDVADFSGLWLRVDGPTTLLGFDNMDPRPVKGTTDWTRYEVVLDVPETAVRLAFGLILMGTGQVWADDLNLEVVDPREVKSTQLIQFGVVRAEHATNFDFEAIDVADAVPGWDIHHHGTNAYAHRIATTGAHGGRTFLEGKSTDHATPLSFSAAQTFMRPPTSGSGCDSARTSRPKASPTKRSCRWKSGGNTPGFARAPLAAG
ncbi:MAG: hypothetical protein ACLQIB_50885 [Isosphaeraceae bacterium]